MQTPFYLNPETLGRRYFSRYDLIAMIILLAFTLWVGLTFSAAVGGGNSTPLRTGAGLSYAGLIIGVYMHLAKQTKRGDEFSQKIISQSLAKAGLITVFHISFMTTMEGVFDFMDNVPPELWASFAPILLLIYAYLFARISARNYTK